MHCLAHICIYPSLQIKKSDDDIYTNAVGLGSAYEAFEEADEVKKWISDLNHLSQSSFTTWERHHEQFTIILDRYQEQPHLLDPHLPDLMKDLLKIIRAAEIPRSKPEATAGDESGEFLPPGPRHAAAAFAAHLIKVRKAKVVVRHFPHEVADVEPVLSLLELQVPGEDHWETRYVLLLWMSMLVLIPFDMARFDSGQEKLPLMERILNVIKRYLGVTSRCQDAAAFLASRFLTRPEIVRLHLPAFLDWAMAEVTDPGAVMSDNALLITVVPQK